MDSIDHYTIYKTIASLMKEFNVVSDTIWEVGNG